MPQACQALLGQGYRPVRGLKPAEDRDQGRGLEASHDLALRDEREAYTTARTTPTERILAVFDYLYEWFGQPDYRGCAFINSFAELGAASENVAEIVRTHKRAFADHIAALVAAADQPPARAGQLLILANGAMVTAAIAGSPEPAREARAAAQRLLGEGVPD